MPNPRFSLLVASAVLVLGLVGNPTLLRAQTPAPDDAKRHAAAEEYLKARNTEEIVNSTVNRMGEMTDRISDSASKQAGPSVNPQEFAQKLRGEARAMISKDFNWAALRPEFVQAYSQAFTETELKDLTAFYQTPTGKKLVATEPEISGRLSKLSQEKAMSIMPRVVQHLRELVAATKPPGAPGNNNNLLVPPPPPGLSVPPSPPPGLMIPPPPPPGMVPNAPSSGPLPVAPPLAYPPFSAKPPMGPSSTVVPSPAPSARPDGRSETGTR